MPKIKVKLQDRAIHWFTYHPWLKLFALLLAIVLWLYVKGKIAQ